MSWETLATAAGSLEMNDGGDGSGLGSSSSLDRSGSVRWPALKDWPRVQLLVSSFAVTLRMRFPEPRSDAVAVLMMSSVGRSPVPAIKRGEGLTSCKTAHAS